MSHTEYPRLIQGGMGVGVSNWRLARAVARRGHLGVVSGSVLDTLFVRRLQDGDPGGHLRRAMEHFPMPGVASTVLERWFRPARGAGEPYELLPMYRRQVSAARQQLTMLAGFVEVWLAREGHDGPVGLNLLTKVQLPNLALLYGAMLAGVQYVLMGAGIPREIPGVLDALAEHRAVSMRMDVEGGDGTELLALDPLAHWQPATPLVRPRFLAIVSASSLATTLVRKASGRVDGLVIEGPTAGGHNAPPRGTLTLDASGQPVYGERDAVDLAKIRELGVPFWLAGGSGAAGALDAALAQGAAGVQVGTLFAFAEESGLDAAVRREALEAIRDGRASVFTDPKASPTGYPFKLLQVAGVEPRERVRNCDLGYLRTAFRRDDGRIDYRCPAEPVEQYVAKGGDAADTVGRKCLCNGLLANVGHAQVTDDETLEPTLLTTGDGIDTVRELLGAREAYTADDVIDFVVA